VPFLRYTRDRRGYETTYLVHGYRSAPGAGGETRVLYLFRSPAHVKVGRRAFDEEAREALEHTHPDLTFDWTALGREPFPHHFEDRDRSGPNGRRGSGTRAQVPRPVRTPEDQTPLGRVLGASEAARLRGRYSDLLRRIERRAPTPEDRDRLTGRVQRLNPDDWTDEAAVRSGVQTIEATWDAVRRELPSRRRGRRSGDRQPPQATQERHGAAALAGDEPEAGRPSAIIDPGTGEADAREDDREGARADRGASAVGDGDPVGPGTDDDPAGDRFPGGE
jgi:hypothetical protein